MRSARGVLVLGLVAAGCAQGHTVTDGGRDAQAPAMDAAPSADARVPADARPTLDGGRRIDAARDAAPPDAGRDAGPSDAGTDAFAPSDAGCPIGTTRCAGACVDTQTSSLHCGACGDACPAGETCALGACVPPVVTWSTRATTFDCGSPGVIGSRATFTCPPGGSSASLWGTGEYTHDSSICTAAVHAGRITFAGGGAITIELRPGRSSYVGSTQNGVTSSSYGSWSCSFAVVGPACPPSAADECEDRCVDTSSDVMHCGACGGACASGATCTASVCACPSALTLCSGTCVDTQTSAIHCGACGTACGPDRACTAGSCGCGPGLTECGGACVDTSSDPTSCGGCGVTCATGMVCGLGTCGARAITWTTNATEHDCGAGGVIGARFAYACPASGTAGSAWGTDVYTHDSSICTAAVHAGLITLASGGAVTIEMAPGQSAYPGSTRNGITTLSWGSWSCSYLFPP